VRAEFDRYSNRHHEIDERHGVEWDVPEKHAAEHVKQDHTDCQHYDHGRYEVKTEDQECNYEHRCQGDA